MNKSSQALKILKENVVFFFLLLVIIVCVYGNTLSGQFLSADDIPGIVNNPLVKDLNTSLGSFELEKILPALFYAAFGMSPLPYHLTALIMHVTNTMLVFLLIFLIFGKKHAVITTFVFALHPINSEAISWISAYGYLFYGFVTLLILVTYVLWHQTKDPKYLWTSVAIYIFSIIFYRKPWVALIPVYVFLLDQFILETKFNFKKYKAYVYLAIPTLLYLVFYIRTLFAYRQETLVTLYYNDPAKATPYFNRVLYTIYMTVKLFLWPINLTIYHEGEKVPSINTFTIISGLVTLFIVGLVIFLLATTAKRGIHRKHIAGLIVLIYSCMLLSFYPEVVVWAMAERYLYIASIFFGLIIAILVDRARNKELAIFLLVLVLLFYGVRSLIRTNAWRNTRNLWVATQRVSPYSYRVYNNLGDVYSSEGNYAEAIKNFQMSLQLEPRFADAVHNLGFTYYELGDLEQAKYYLEKSYEMNPLLYQSLDKLGVIAYQQGNVELAKQYMQKALEINPDFEPAKNHLQILMTLPLTTQQIK